MIVKVRVHSRQVNECKDRSLSYGALRNAVASLAFLSVSVSVAAPEVVVQAPRAERDSSRNPGSVTVIRPDETEGRDRTLGDLLEREAGVRIRRYGGRGAYTTVSLRGANPNQVRVYIDGIPLNNAVTGEVNLADLDPQAFSRIEIHRSGSGDASAGGAVHLYTAVGGPLRKGTQVHMEGGSFGTAGAGARAFSSGSPLAYNVSARGEVSRQDFRFHNNNGTPVLNTFDDFDDVRENAGYRNLFSTGSAAYQSGQTRWSFLNDFVYRLHGLPGPITAPTEQVRRKFLRNTSGAASDSKGLGFDWLRLKSRAYYTESRESLDDFLQEFSFSLPNSHARLQQFGAEMEPLAYLVGAHQTVRLLLGVERQIYHSDRRNRFDDLVERQPTRFRNSGSGRVEDEFSFFDERLLILPAAAVSRYADRYQEPEAETDPGTGLPRAPKRVTEFTQYSFGITAKPIRSREWIWTVRGQGETGGRMPLFVELFGERGSIIGNPGLEPERSESVEVGTTVERRSADLTLSATTTVFRRTLRDMILFVPNSQFTLRPENVDAAHIRGAELVLKGLYLKRWRAFINYTYQRAINRSDLPFLRGKYLPLRPLSEAHVGASYRGGHIEPGFEVVYVGAVFKDRSNEVVAYEPARTLVNLFVVWSVFGRDVLVRSWLVGLDIKNVGDVRATDVTGFPLPGRSVYAKTSYLF